MRGGVNMSQAAYGGRPCDGRGERSAGGSPACRVLHAAGQAGAVPHVAAHELRCGRFYAIKAARADAPEGERDTAGQLECRWQRDQLPAAIRELVLDDQRLRNDICW